MLEPGARESWRRRPKMGLLTLVICGQRKCGCRHQCTARGPWSSSHMQGLCHRTARPNQYCCGQRASSGLTLMRRSRQRSQARRTFLGCRELVVVPASMSGGGGRERRTGRACAQRRRFLRPSRPDPRKTWRPMTLLRPALPRNSARHHGSAMSVVRSARGQALQRHAASPRGRARSAPTPLPQLDGFPAYY